MRRSTAPRRAAGTGSKSRREWCIALRDASHREDARRRDDRRLLRRNPADGSEPRTHASRGAAQGPRTGFPRPALRGSLLLAAREGHAAGRDIPGGRERLHEGDERRRPAVRRQPVRGDARADPADRPERPDAPGPLLLLPAHGRGAAVPDPLPPRRRRRRQPPRGRPRAGAARPERDGEGPRVPLDRRVRGERRRPAAALLDGRDRLPPVLAVREGPEDGRRARPARRARHERRVGGRQPQLLLRDRRPRHQAPGHPVAAGGGRAAGEAPRGEGRALLDRCLPDQGPEVRRSRQPLDGHLGPLAASRARRPRAASGSCCPARRATSTTSSTATARSSSAPTRTRRTSGS